MHDVVDVLNMNIRYLLAKYTNVYQHVDCRTYICMGRIIIYEQHIITGISNWRAAGCMLPSGFNRATHYDYYERKSINNFKKKNFVIEITCKIFQL